MNVHSVALLENSHGPSNISHFLLHTTASYALTYCLVTVAYTVSYILRLFLATGHSTAGPLPLSVWWQRALLPSYLQRFSQAVRLPSHQLATVRLHRQMFETIIAPYETVRVNTTKLFRISWLILDISLTIFYPNHSRFRSVLNSVWLTVIPQALMFIQHQALQDEHFRPQSNVAVLPELMDTDSHQDLVLI